MLEYAKSTEQYLYHYTKAPTALRKILKFESLKFGQYLSTNDPQETKAWEFSLGSNDGRDLGAYNMKEMSAWLSGEMKRKTSLACFSMDSPPLTGDHLSDLTKRGYCKPRMWAQYANNHSGVCLIFDRAKLVKEVDDQLGDRHFIISGPVQYIDPSPIPNLADQEFMINVDYLEEVGKEQYAESHLRAHFARLFFQKMTDWKNETEWRSVVFSPSEEKIFVNIRKALAGIMFGEKTSVRDIKAIMALTKSWSVWFMGLKWKNSGPWYDYASLRYVPGIENSPWGKHLK